MSDHVHECPTHKYNAYRIYRSPWFELQSSECIDCLRAKIRRLEEKRIEERAKAIARMNDDQLREAYEDLREVAHALGICDEAEGIPCTPGHLPDLLACVKELNELRTQLIEKRLPNTKDSWCEEDGAVLWWKFPITEPPYVGTPLDDDFPDEATFWTVIDEPREPFSEGLEEPLA